MQSENATYLNWSIAPNGTPGGFEAVRGAEDQTLRVSLALDEAHGVYEGQWPQGCSIPKNPIIATGTCLWDGRWVIEFAPKGKVLPPARPLALGAHRDKAYAKLREGYRPAAIYVPRAPGEYHRRLIGWQARQLQRLQPERILYHLPLREYQIYIDMLEQELQHGLAGLYEETARRLRSLKPGQKLRDLPSHDSYHELEHTAQWIPQACASMRQEIKKFAVAVKQMVLAEFAEFTDRLEFVEPMTRGASSPEESFLFPYLRPELFGVMDSERLLGLEDLVEVRISAEVERQTGRRVPVVCTALGTPSPYGERTGEVYSIVAKSERPSVASRAAE